MNFFYDDQLIYHIDSDFYKDLNGDGVIHIPVLFGDDYTHTDASYTFRVSDLIMKWIQEKSLEWYSYQIDFQYSTVDEYLKSL